ncbi:hypothetical protein LEN26_012544 [Aphanomyces euteiches]|nr:hypothetical protein LEN26_012544 [Aphanomyces euteiches]
MNQQLTRQAEQFLRDVDAMAADAYAFASATNQDEAIVKASLEILKGIFEQSAARISTSAGQVVTPSERLRLSRSAATHAPCQNAYSTYQNRLSGVYTNEIPSIEPGRPCGYDKTHRKIPCRNASHKCKFVKHVLWRFHLYRTSQVAPTWQEQTQIGEFECTHGTEVLNQFRAQVTDVYQQQEETAIRFKSLKQMVQSQPLSWLFYTRNVPYQNLIGDIEYLVSATCPDITNSVRYFASHSHDLTQRIGA